MFAKFKAGIINAVGSLDNSISGLNSPDGSRTQYQSPNSLHTLDRGPPLKFRYTRPQFLQLNSDDEILVSADHAIRPIIVPRDISKLPWNSGYAECINAGKSIRNEDQASMYKGLLRAIVSPENVAAKVADMMPTIPGYPRQVPINASKLPSPPNPFDVKEVSALVEQPVPGHSAVVDAVANKNEAALESTEPKTNIPDAGLPENGSANSNESRVNGVQGTAGQAAKFDVPDLLSPSEPLSIADLTISHSSGDLVVEPTTPLSPKKTSAIIEESLPYVYYGMFDGHAGSGVAVAAANSLQKIVQERLQSIADLLIEFGLKKREQNEDGSDKDEEPECYDRENTMSINKNTTLKGSVIINHDKHLPEDSVGMLFQPAIDKIITVDNLIIGALEASFWEMDKDIEHDKRLYKMSGGCTAVVSLFILGKLYVANAGDSRCVMYKNSQVVPLSFDFTPESERERVKYLGLLRPELLGSDFTQVEFVRRPNRRDLGKKLLYRDAYMSGWSYKTVTVEDLRFPLVYGEGKRSRVLATIGVTRGFGDHELKAQNSQVDIKPFLTPQPEVRVLDLEKEENLTESDVIIMGTDGLWDVTSNEKACEVVQKALDHFPANDQQRFKYRYISAAQDLVMTSRGKSKENSKSWKTFENKVATIDDISVFVIPLKPYQQEFKKWKEARDLVKTISNEAESSDR